jgi:hypothetical protein
MIRKMIALGHPQVDIIDQSVELITAEFRPSRFGYVCTVIASEFPKTFLKRVKIDELAYQVLDAVSACEPVFGLLKFNSHTTEQHSIYITVSNFIRHYLKRKKRNLTPQPQLHAVGKRSESVLVTQAETATVLNSVVGQAQIVNQTIAEVRPVSYFDGKLLENSVAITGQISSHSTS